MSDTLGRSALVRLDAAFAREVLRLRARYQLSLDEFRGLYVSDEQADALLARSGSAPTALEEAPPLERSPALATVMARFELDETATDLMLLALAPDIDLKYPPLIAYLNDDVRRRWPTVDLARRLFGRGPSLTTALSPGGPLFGPGLLLALPGTDVSNARLPYMGCLETELAAVPVDREGLSTAAGRRLAPHAKLASVTPSHHYPLGTTMSLARRLDLLDWARGAGAVVVEDDFNGEFRYGGRALTALYGLDGGARVIYTGTFSRAMFPALRLAYMVTPAPLTDAFVRARGQLDGYAVAVTQAAVAAFMESGSFAAHIRRMRALYKERQDTLVGLAKRYLKGALELEPSDAGLHLVGRLPPGVSDERVAAELAGSRVAPGILSRFYLNVRAVKPSPSGLLLNYAAWPEAELSYGVLALAKAIAAAGRR